MKFPAIGDNVPQSFGHDVWDPYVMNMVDNELEQVYHFSQRRSTTAATSSRPAIDDAKMEALYQAVSQNEAQIDDELASRSSPTCTSGRCWRTRPTARSRPLYPGPGYRSARSTTGPGPVITAKECTRDQTAK